MDLKILLKQLQEGNIDHIEYGPKNEQPGNFLSAFRVRYMQTMGGMQFRICQLFHGREGGGIYRSTIDEAHEKCTNLVSQFLSNTQNSKLYALIRKPYIAELPKCEWFSFKDGDQIKRQTICTEEEINRMLPNAKTTTLELP